MATTPPLRLSTHLAQVLVAVRDGRVLRDDCRGERAGMWALYVLDGAEVGLQVRQLARYGFVEAPLVGAPRLTPDGRSQL